MPTAVAPSSRHRCAPSSCSGTRQGCLGKVPALCKALAFQAFDPHSGAGSCVRTSGLLTSQCCAYCEGDCPAPLGRAALVTAAGMLSTPELLLRWRPALSTLWARLLRLSALPACTVPHNLPSSAWMAAIIALKHSLCMGRHPCIQARLLQAREAASWRWLLLHCWLAPALSLLPVHMVAGSLRISR